LNPSDSDMLALLGFTFVVPVAALFVGFGVAGWVSAFVAFILAAAAVGGYACFYSKTKLPRKTAAYHALLERWEHSWLCLRCGNKFYLR